MLLEAINKNFNLETLELDDDFLYGYAVIGMLLGGALVVAVAVAYMKLIYKIQKAEETNGLTYVSHKKDEGEEGITMALIKPEDKLTTRNTSNVKIENSDLMNTTLIMTEKEVITTVNWEPMTNNFEKEEEEENEPWVGETVSHKKDEGEEGITMALIKPEDKLTTRNTSNVKIKNRDLMNTTLIMTDKEDPMTNNFEKEEEEENEPLVGETDKIKKRKEDGCYEDLMAEIREEWKRRNNI